MGPAQSGSLPRSGHIDHVPALVTELLMNGQDSTGDAAASIGDVLSSTCVSLVAARWRSGTAAIGTTFGGPG
ncbi:MAG TPA: hypothetical protein VF788_16530 [Pseudonocardiaceae bacterium]